MHIVNFIYNEEQISIYALYPILVNKSRFKDLGFNFNFYKKISPKIYDCDYLIIFSKAIQKLLKKKKSIFSKDDEIIKFLIDAKSRVKKVIWFDTSDSTSVTHFEVMPFIDLYLKKQIFVDKKNYQKKLYGGRIFTDYYHKKYSINDEKIFNQYFPLKKKYFSKLQLSWNVGIGNILETFDEIKVLFRKLFPLNFHTLPNPNFQDPSKKKIIDFFFRGSLNYERKTINFHRELLIKKLKTVQKRLKLNGVSRNDFFNEDNLNNKTFLKANGRLSLKEYNYLMSIAKFGLSPFGWGEIGARDFEIFVNGSLLIKPDMSHLETYPVFYKPMKTYVPIRWDFDDLEYRMSDLINNKKKIEEISLNGQENYRDIISSDGMENFCKWFENQIKL